MKSKQVGKYTINEPRVGDMMPIMDLIEKDPKQFQLQLAMKCVMLDGKPIGEGINELPISEYMSIVAALMELFNGEGK
jgi:hypothetical protein